MSAQLVSVNARCQCARYPGHACLEAITQEDLLCDGCRAEPLSATGITISTGCAVLIVNGKQAAWHVKAAMER